MSSWRRWTRTTRTRLTVRPLLDVSSTSSASSLASFLLVHFGGQMPGILVANRGLNGGCLCNADNEFANSGVMGGKFFAARSAMVNSSCRRRCSWSAGSRLRVVFVRRASPAATRRRTSSRSARWSTRTSRTRRSTLSGISSTGTRSMPSRPSCAVAGREPSEEGVWARVSSV